MSAIGFRIPPEHLLELAQRGAQDAPRFDTPAGAYRQWSVGAGVELWLQQNAAEHMVGCNPHFAGQGRLEVALIETVSVSGRPLDGHGFGWAAPRDPGNPYSGLHSFAANLPDFAFVDERILIPSVVTLQVAAFTASLESFPTETAFMESELGQAFQAEDGSRPWQQSEDEGLPRPEAFIVGQVASCELRANPITGQEFYALLVRTESGSIDVVSDLETSPRRPATGAIIAGSFWLSARPVGELPAARTPAPETE